MTPDGHRTRPHPTSPPEAAERAGRAALHRQPRGGGPGTARSSPSCTACWRTTPPAASTTRRRWASSRRRGTSTGQAQALFGLGVARAQFEDHKGAIERIAQAAALYNEREGQGGRGALPCVHRRVPARAGPDGRRRGEVPGGADPLPADAQHGRAWRALLLDIGDIRMEAGDYKRARERFLEALTLLEKGEEPEPLALCQLLLGEAEGLLGNHEAARPHLLAAVELYAQLHDHVYESRARWDLGLCVLPPPRTFAAARACSSRRCCPSTRSRAARTRPPRCATCSRTSPRAACSSGADARAHRERPAARALPRRRACSATRRAGPAWCRPPPAAPRASPAAATPRPCAAVSMATCTVSDCGSASIASDAEEHRPADHGPACAGSGRSTAPRAAERPIRRSAGPGRGWPLAPGLPRPPPPRSPWPPPPTRRRRRCRGLAHFHRLGHSPSPPFQNICAATTSNTTANSFLSTAVGTFGISRLPTKAPASTPTTSGATSAQLQVPAPRVGRHARGARHADHQVAGGAGHLEGHPHPVAHQRHLERAAAHAQQRGQPARHERAGDAQRVVRRRVVGGRRRLLAPRAHQQDLQRDIEGEEPEHHRHHRRGEVGRHAARR